MKIKKQLFLFWKIGEFVFKKQNICENVVLKCSNYLSYYYGMSETFSVSNIHYMKRFYSCFPIYIEEFNKLDFEYYKLLVNVCELNKRYFYFKVILFCRGSLEELRQIILCDLYDYI